MHIKSFAVQEIRPAGNDIVTYDLTINQKGQPRADNVAFVRERAPRQARPAVARSLAAAAGFSGLIALLVFTGALPLAAVFWLTVVVNCGALGWMLTASGSNARGFILGAP